MFNNLAHESAGIPPGPNQLEQASVEQLMMVRAWMIDRIREHCVSHDESLPQWASGRGD
jgi:hypothetical protein